MDSWVVADYGLSIERNGNSTRKTCTEKLQSSQVAKMKNLDRVFEVKNFSYILLKENHRMEHKIIEYRKS